MHRTWITAVALAAAMLGAPRAHAQLASGDGQAGPFTATASGPTLAGTTLSPHLAISAERTNAAAARPFGLSQTLMIVGGAAFLAGAIIGDDAGTVMMVAGAGVGLYGLYLYLRQPTMSGDGAGVGLGYRVPVGS
jgi:hypothetical protein